MTRTKNRTLKDRVNDALETKGLVTKEDYLQAMRSLINHRFTEPQPDGILIPNKLLKTFYKIVCQNAKRKTAKQNP